MSIARGSGRFIRAGVLTLAAGLCAGGCPRPEDGLEPNDTFEQAVPLAVGQPLEGRVVQSTVDVFSVTAGPDQTLVFRLESLGGEDCPDFTVTDPQNTILYDGGYTTCSRGLSPVAQVPGATLTEPEDGGYELTVPADILGTYFLTITELGYADNIFTFSWDYRLTVTLGS